jgi:hypothetical protein
MYYFFVSKNTLSSFLMFPEVFMFEGVLSVGHICLKKPNMWAYSHIFWVYEHSDFFLTSYNFPTFFVFKLELSIFYEALVLYTQQRSDLATFATC